MQLFISNIGDLSAIDRIRPRKTSKSQRFVDSFSRKSIRLWTKKFDRWGKRSRVKIWLFSDKNMCERKPTRLGVRRSSDNSTLTSRRCKIIVVRTGIRSIVLSLRTNHQSSNWQKSRVEDYRQIYADRREISFYRKIFVWTGKLTFDRSGNRFDLFFERNSLLR